MNTTVYLCEDNLESILTAVYDAWASGAGHSHVRLQMNCPDTMALFCDYVTVHADISKSEKVVRAIRQKISEDAWYMVYRAAMSPDPEKADAIYRFLRGGFYFGAKVTRMLTEPAVQKIFQLDRKVSNEAHYFKEFLRFDAMDHNILFARIRPKCNVIAMVAPHFADRLSGENFLILDVGRSLAALHPADRQWYLTALSRKQAETLLAQKEDEYRDLWKTFHDAIAIEARKNPKLQPNLMPLWCREFMPENT